jgi:hypothetical protein
MCQGLLAPERSLGAFILFSKGLFMRKTFLVGAVLTASCALGAGCKSNNSSGAGGTTTSSGSATTSTSTAANTSSTTTGTGTGGAMPSGGNVLVADQFNNRVIEVDRTGKIVWSFGDGGVTPGKTSVIAPNDAERLPNGQTLISGSGAPSMSEPMCAGANGCQDNRVILVDMTGKIVWQYGQDGVAGAAAGQLNTPVSATMLKSGNVLISDQGNQRVIEVTMAGAIAWQFGVTGTSGSDATHLNAPNSAERLDNGNTLIADENNNRIMEVDTTGALVWQYPTTPTPTMLEYAAFASRLANGNTLVSDAGNNRIIEVDKTGAVVWKYVTSMRPGSVMAPTPTRGVRLKNGDTLIADQNNNQVIEVDPAGKNVLFTYGMIGVAGNAAGQLNAPYDAKVVGDYTGLTAPQ